MKTFTHNTKNFTAAAVAAVCLATVAMGAHADETVNGAPARAVHYADLNLNTQAGAAVLFQRIRYAAERVCGDGDVRELARAAAAKACVDRAVITGVRAVNNPKLTAEYNAHTGVAQPINVAALR